MKLLVYGAHPDDPEFGAGGVAALEGVGTPSLVAKAVLDNTDHHLLVGKGAQEFARKMGFKIEDDLNTEKSRKLWLEWKRRIDPKHYLDPKKRGEHVYKIGLQLLREGLIDESSFWGTIDEVHISNKRRSSGWIMTEYNNQFDPSMGGFFKEIIPEP